MSQAELPRDLNAQLADEVTEKYWQLIRQNRPFCCALTAAIKSGKETAAGLPAPVRTGRGSVGRAIASGLFHDHPDVGRSQTARSSYTSATLADFSRARDSQITFSVTHGWSAFWRGRPWFAER